MIEITNLNKSYEGYPAVSALTLSMAENEVFGLVGTNGAGKTTLLRMMTGILRQDGGEIAIDGEGVFDNPRVKERIFFIPDDPYFFPNSRPVDMMRHYGYVYPEFSEPRFYQLMNDFELDVKRRIGGFSKGMKKQLSVILGLSARTKYLFCDETFDGLDPLMRQATKSLIAKDMDERGLTTVMTSHNLRELEDICDHVGILHQGGVLLSKDVADLKVDIQKLQCVFTNAEDAERVEKGLSVLAHKAQGRMQVYTVRNRHEDIERIFEGIDTIYFEILPLTLEEIFISETEVVGYDIRKIIEG